MLVVEALVELLVHGCTGQGVGGLGGGGNGVSIQMIMVVGSNGSLTGEMVVVEEDRTYWWLWWWSFGERW